MLKNVGERVKCLLLKLNRNKNKLNKKIKFMHDVINEQADSINFLIQQLDMVRSKNIDLTRQVRELKKQLKEVENGK